MTLSSHAMRVTRAVVPRGARRWLRAQQVQHRLQPNRAGSLDLGDLRRLTPVSDLFGFDRGLPIDRYYIGAFLGRHASDIRGRVLEMGDASYTHQFGGERVTQSDVLDVVDGNPDATLVADLTCADQIPSDTFDAIVCTQTLQMIYDFRAAMTHLHRILKPGGVLLLTAGQITKIARREGRDDWGEYWHFTAQALEHIATEVFPARNTTIDTYGNVLTASSFLYGIASDELSPEELAHEDPDYEVIVALRSVKEPTPSRA